MTRTLGILAIAAIVASQLVARPAVAHPSIDVVASNWKFTPNTIELHVGQETTLRLSSSEGVHGLASDDLGIPLTTISSGSVKTINVTAKKPGKFILHCAVMCGAGHADMTLTVNVVP